MGAYAPTTLQLLVLVLKTYIKKCSGGQVKRVCIGVELVAKPDILVLGNVLFVN